jgi:hypothetical protein
MISAVANIVPAAGAYLLIFFGLLRQSARMTSIGLLLQQTVATVKTKPMAVGLDQARI